MSEWRPIASAPRDGYPVLLYDERADNPKKTQYIGRFSTDWGWWLTIPGDVHWCPSHWMPLPAAPPTPAAASGTTTGETK